MAKLRYKYVPQVGDVVQLDCYGTTFLVSISKIDYNRCIHGMYKCKHKGEWSKWQHMGGFDGATNIHIVDAVCQPKPEEAH